MALASPTIPRSGPRQRSYMEGSPVRKQTFSLSRWSWLKYITSNPLGEFWLTSFRINVGVHRRSSVQRPYICHGFAGYITRRPSATANTHNLHRGFMDTDATLLGQGPSLTARSLRNLARFPHSVGFLPVPMVIQPLTWTHSCVQQYTQMIKQAEKHL